MSYQVEPLIYEQFKGIREYNGVNAGGQISAIQCKNVKLVQTEIGSNTGIQSMEGNTVVYTLPLGYAVKGIFNSNQDGVDYRIIYGENAEQGALFFVNIAEQVGLLVDGLTRTGECNGITVKSTAFDVFVFTNGAEVKTVAFTADTAYSDVIKDHNPVEFSQGFIADIAATDYLGRTIKWLAMTEWNGFLVVASEYGVHSSHQNDIYTWNEDPQDIADAWYIDFSKKVTAVHGFTGGLYIFTEDDCTLLNTTPNDTTNSRMVTSAGVGCYSYTSIVKHDIYLFFYDNNQKNVYYLTATDTTGQIKPNGPVAKEIQSYFSKISRFKMYSCIYDNNNEIWCLINDNILIYDYARGEWITRQEQQINSLALIENTILTGGENGVVYAEYVNEDFSGAYFPCVYQTTFINAGSNSNLKKQKTPLLLTLNANFTNKFYVQLTINNKAKNPKRVNLNKNATGIFAPEDGSSIDPRTKFGTAKFSPENTYKKTVVEISTPQTWYTMGIKIFTQELGDGFFINSMELKNIKVKTKTKGR